MNTDKAKPNLNYLWTIQREAEAQRLAAENEIVEAAKQRLTIETRLIHPSRPTH